MNEDQRKNKNIRKKRWGGVGMKNAYTAPYRVIQCGAVWFQTVFTAGNTGYVWYCSFAVEVEEDVDITASISSNGVYKEGVKIERDAR